VVVMFVKYMCVWWVDVGQGEPVKDARRLQVRLPPWGVESRAGTGIPCNQGRAALLRPLAPSALTTLTCRAMPTRRVPPLPLQAASRCSTSRACCGSTAGRGSRRRHASRVRSRSAPRLAASEQAAAPSQRQLHAPSLPRQTLPARPCCPDELTPPPPPLRQCWCVSCATRCRACWRPRWRTRRWT
jgi:hypothetical protein